MSAPARKPSRLRFAVFVFLAVYPLVVAISYLVGPLILHLPIWERNLITVPIIVASMVWGIIPQINRHCARWL
ncbi:hypothetical protein [Actibacterium sp. D379-3]